MSQKIFWNTFKKRKDGTDDINGDWNGDDDDDSHDDDDDDDL